MKFGPGFFQSGSQFSLKPVRPFMPGNQPEHQFQALNLGLGAVSLAVLLFRFAILRREVRGHEELIVSRSLADGKE